MTNGPPTVNPYCWKLNGGFLVAFHGLAFIASSWKNISAAPWRSFVPDLLTALTTADSASPNSAEKRLVSTWTSLMDSRP